MICIIVILFIIICLLCYYLYTRNRIKPDRIIENYTTNRAPQCDFPFRNIKDHNYDNLNIIAITAPFREDEHKRMFYQYKSQGFPILGCTSYLEFPGHIPNPYEDPYYASNHDDYINEVIGWSHCFRPNSDLYKLIEHRPNILISESDFLNLDNMHYDKNEPKVYDFIYICLEDNEHCMDGWQSYIREWDLAKECFSTLCAEKYKGLLIGRDKCAVVNESCLLEFDKLPFQQYNDFHKLMLQTKILFVPNVSDASPRVVTEAMTLNVPVLMNENIVGGWKYINKKTGEFFNGTKEDFYKQFTYMMNHLDNYQPRPYILNVNKNTKKKFTAFVKKIFPGLLDCEYCRFAI